MRTKVKTFVGSLAGCVLFVSTAAAQTQTPSGSSALDQALYRSLAERVQMPLAFATRDSLFNLSLPADEPAEVYIRLTVGKNGKVKEKLTRVNANHIARYVAPAFVVATKDMRIDRALLAGIVGKDTSLTLTFPLAYQCVLDTMNKAWPSSEYETPELYYQDMFGYPVTGKERDRRIESWVGSYVDLATDKYIHSESTRVWYYLAFIKDQPE